MRWFDFYSNHSAKYQCYKFFWGTPLHQIGGRGLPSRILKLNAKQWTSLQESVAKETKLWSTCLIERGWQPNQIGPRYECDDFGLPHKLPNVKQPSWIHNRRKFLQSLSFQERNLVLTGDPYLEFDPCSYILVYSCPTELKNYPALQAHFQHLLENPQPILPPPPPPPNIPLPPQPPRTLRSGRTLGEVPPPRKYTRKNSAAANTSANTSASSNPVKSTWKGVKANMAERKAAAKLNLSSAKSSISKMLSPQAGPSKKK